MRRTSARVLLLLGLGAVAGAVFPHAAAAQVPVRRDTVAGRRDTLPTRTDTVGGVRERLNARPDTVLIPVPARADSMLRNDSLNRGVVPLPRAAISADTLRPPLARAAAPRPIEIGPARSYDRAALFATGALTLGDLLSRTPGLTGFTTGWLGAPTVVASLGDLRRVRLYLDGLELDPMDPRSRGVAPVNDLPLSVLEDLRIERGVDEVRVYARTWRVDRTIPYTRADVATGDQNTNLYRAFYGRRFTHGEALQVAAEQYNTQPDRRLPSTDGLNVSARVGLTHGPWSVDAFGMRTDRNRAPWAGLGDPAQTRDTLAGVETRRQLGYLRLGNGDPERGRWLQLVASSVLATARPRSSTEAFAAPGGAPRDTSPAAADSGAYENQYVLAGGATRGPLRLSATERLRTVFGRLSHVASARGEMVAGPIATGMFAEGRSYLQPGRLDATVRVTPGSRLALLGVASRTRGGTFDRRVGETSVRVLDTAGVFDPIPPLTFGNVDTLEAKRYTLASSSSLRAEAGVRVRDFWVSGGVIRRGATTLLPPGELDTSATRAPAVRVEGPVSARTLAVRGRVYRALHADAWALAWNDSGGFYRPRYQTRTELYIQTQLLDRFPRGNFGLLASLAHEYRSSVRFASADSARTAPGFRTLDFKLEIRIQTAVVSYQFRNLLQERYSQVPGFPMPRQTQFYGVRWDFWN